MPQIHGLPEQTPCPAKTGRTSTNVAPAAKARMLMTWSRMSAAVEQPSLVLAQPGLGTWWCQFEQSRVSEHDQAGVRRPGPDGGVGRVELAQQDRGHVLLGLLDGQQA